MLAPIARAPRWKIAKIVMSCQLLLIARFFAWLDGAGVPESTWAPYYRSSSGPPRLLLIQSALPVRVRFPSSGLLYQPTQSSLLPDKGKFARNRAVPDVDTSPRRA